MGVAKEGGMLLRVQTKEKSDNHSIPDREGNKPNDTERKQGLKRL